MLLKIKANFFYYFVLIPFFYPKTSKCQIVIHLTVMNILFEDFYFF